MASLRLPPPTDPARTATEQWIIDALLHLDECLDEHKREGKQDTKVLQDAQMELRAEVTAWMATATASDSSLIKRIEAHELEHRQIEELHKAKHSVWKMQLSWLNDAFRLATSGGVLLVFGAAAKMLGIL